MKETIEAQSPNLDPRATESNPPVRPAQRRETELPRIVKDNKDSDAPHLADNVTDVALPKAKDALIDNELLHAPKSRTDHDFPNLA